MIYPQSDAIFDEKTGEVLIYSELLKGNREIMPKSYTIYPQSGLLKGKDGKDIDLVELLLNRSSGGESSDREIEFQIIDGYIQWRYVGDENWINLISLDELKGKDGKDGITPNIQIGTVTTLEPNQQATVENVGTKENPIFDFGIPRGQDGTGGDSGELKSHINTVILEEPVNTIKINSDKNNVSFAELNITSISMLITANYETSGYNYAALAINGKSIVLGQNMALYAKDGVYKIDFALHDDGTATLLCQSFQYGKSTSSIAFGIPFDGSYNPVVFGNKIENIEFKHAGSSNLATDSKIIIYGR